MKDVIVRKQSSLIHELVEAMMFLKLNTSLILSNPTNNVESPIWNTLIPPRLELPYDIDDSNDDENEEEDDVDEDDDLSLVSVKSEEANHTC